MARIQIEDKLAHRARRLGIQLTWFANRMIRQECERMEKQEKKAGR